ncbi:MAG: hypothetical protein JWM80_1787 [Cyanobacteria bacterium RYN_339]|nr:hypothetical protein [Cyanobacteria bacterium RYN_339]
MNVQPTRVRALGGPRVAAASLPAQPSVPMKAAAATDALGTFKNTVVQAVAYAQEARDALEVAGQAVNAGTGSREAFNTAQAGFNAAVGTLNGLEASGKHFNAPFWNPWGFKVARFFRECGAKELQAYRPPTLGTGQPAPASVFEVKLAEARKAAADGVDPELALPDLLKEAQTTAQIQELMALGRKGRNIGHGDPYYLASSPAYMAKCYARLEAIEQPTTLDAKLAFLARAAADRIDPEPQLAALLKQATTTADVDKIMKAGRKGRNIGTGEAYYLACSKALFTAAYQRLAEIERPQTVDERLGLLKRAAADGMNPEADLVKVLDAAKTPADVDKVLAAGRKGYNVGANDVYYIPCSQTFFAAAHTRQLQLELEKLAAGVIPADRVKFALQPLPTFSTEEDYRNFAVKAASYALVDIQDVLAARQAFAAGTLPEGQLRDAEDGLELSLKLVAALRRAPAAGFDARAFWDQYQVEETAKRTLG